MADSTTNRSEQLHVLVTGGAGYIGSHTCLELLNSGFAVTVIDDLSNSSIEAISRVEHLSGKKIPFFDFSLNSALNPNVKEQLDTLFSEHAFTGVVHFAGYKAVGESVAKPLDYYQNNLTSSLNLFETMKRHGVDCLVFSSSATVYGYNSPPFKEDFELSATNPYGRTKLFIEEMCRDLTHSDKEWRICLLRYFNPIGAHESGEIGEDPLDIPNNLMPYLMQVAIGQREKLQVFGSDYPTPDGTCLRDYVHVVDLARGHLAALNYLIESSDSKGCRAINLGTGKPHSVLEVIKATQTAAGRKVPYFLGPRRPGDVAASYADVTLAKELLGWRAELSLKQCCRDSWNWQQKNPNGYRMERKK